MKAVVSRGGRPDLAGPYLNQVMAPTLLLVEGTRAGPRDEPGSVRPAHMSKELGIVPGATHLFEEPGTLEQVADLALRWFQRYL